MLCTGCNKPQIAEISPASSQRIRICHKSRVQPAHLITQAHQLNWRLSKLSRGHLAPCWMLPFPSRELSWPAPGGMEQQNSWRGTGQAPFWGQEQVPFPATSSRLAQNLLFSQRSHRECPDWLWAPSASITFACSCLPGASWALCLPAPLTHLCRTH